MLSRCHDIEVQGGDPVRIIGANQYFNATTQLLAIE